MTIDNPEEFTEEELALINEEKVYDDAGNIYVDGAGRLRDKQDINFKLRKPEDGDEEVMRLTMFHTVNKMLKGDEQPFVKETYDRLRSEGAGDLEARALLVGVWTEELVRMLEHQTPSSPEAMASSLAALKLPSKRF